MHNKIKAVFGPAEISKKKFLEKIDSYSIEKQKLKPNSDSWSMQEVAYHVYIIEKHSFQFIKNFSFEKKNEDLGILGPIRTFILKRYFHFMPKLKAPKNAAIEIPESVDYNFIKEDWSRDRKEFSLFLETFPEEKLNHFVYKHILTGKVNLIGTLTFCEAHIEHHIKQLNRIVKSKKFKVE